ncbi:MAG: hypothetical protein DMF90_13245 [Acidobacteria bacterium]|nr:MAG: hypothetical protein DMF90_13245 [Acidobacteriota bacterium]
MRSLNPGRPSLPNSNSSHPLVRAFGVGLVVLALAGGLIAAQTQSRPAQAPAESVLRSEFSLDMHTVSVSVSPSLRADDAANKSLFATGASTGSRVRIGQLATNGTLKVGTLAFAKNDLRGLRYDLYLQGTRAGWQLGIVELPPPAPPPGAAAGGPAAASAAGAPLAAAAAAPPAPGTAPPEAAAAPPTPGAAPAGPKPVGDVTLTPHAVSASSPTLVAALVPNTATAGRLVLRWGGLEASTDVQFTEPARLPAGGGGQPGQPVNRKHDEDTTAISRIFVLTQRNETAVVVPKGSRLSVGFARTLTKGQRAGAAAVNLGNGLGVEGPDFARLLSTPDGSVVQLTEAAVPRLAIEAPLRFGKLLLRPGNQAPGLPGAYGLWLKRAGKGWRLVVSQEPDTWGSQYDKASDVGEIDLTYVKGSEADRPFAVALVPTTTDRGRLTILWGPHEWSADYVVGS